MHSQSDFSEVGIPKRIKDFFLSKWDKLSDRHQTYLQKIWGVITFKWRWQIAMNIPYLLIFALDRTVPGVHKFNMDLLATITSRLPIPGFLSSWIGL